MPIPAITPYRFAQVFKAGGFTAALALGLVSAASSQRTIAEQFIQDMKDGKITEAAAEDHVAQELIIKRDIPITCKYISVLMNTPTPLAWVWRVRCATTRKMPAKVTVGWTCPLAKASLKASLKNPNTLYSPQEPTPNVTA